MTHLSVANIMEQPRCARQAGAPNFAVDNSVGWEVGEADDIHVSYVNVTGQPPNKKAHRLLHRRAKSSSIMIA